MGIPDFLEVFRTGGGPTSIIWVKAAERLLPKNLVRDVTPREKAPMIAESVFQAPPLPEGTAPSQPADPIASDKPISSDTEPKRPEDESSFGGSKTNAFKHGCSGSGGKVMTPRDQAEAQRQFQNLCETYDPQTEHEEDLLHTVARER